MTDLKTLTVVAQNFLEQIRNHPDYKQMDYYPDATIPDAIMAVQQLQDAIEYNSKVITPTTPAPSLASFSLGK